MRITFKLFAGLGDYLPAGTRDNTLIADVESGTTAHALLLRFNVPRERARLVMLNGVYLKALERDTRTLQEGDVLAAWPPVAGG